ncbi:hypothetical protein [uncultured Actinomyces sp.]|uniref:hypothetical protein n=1 Tax=uncultured Actinomyces sp. TaxID=249061 RepID=UPI0028E7536C|nr:hypothetical protein [uncultured Actinomyces sp.]
MAPSREAHLAAVLGYPGSGLSSGSGSAPRAGAQGRDADRGTYRGRGPGVATTVLALLLLVLAAACAGYVLGSRQAGSSSDGATTSPVPGGPGGATVASAFPVTGGRP